MLFNSLHFVAFFALVFGAGALLRDRVRVRNAFLLAASYYFYACWDWRFLGLILVSTIVDYACGLMFDVREPVPDGPPPRRTPRRRAILLLSLCTNLGILGFFKYYGFFVSSFVDLFSSFGVELHVRTLHVALPIGISFYTFQTMSYTIDLYRGKIRTERNLLNFALFVAFFPQLVAGPIERAKNLLPQIRRPRLVTWDRISSGFYLMSWGLFKKAVIADNLARVVDDIWARQGPSGLEVVLGCWAFGILLYCDFSGYSDIARGAARCLGFELMLNFRLPFFSTNPTEFWRRWHISLSTWLRDYIYFPLGGSRHGALRMHFAIIATMVASGIWHGSGWPFVVLGFFVGFQLSAHKLLQPVMERYVRPTSTRGKQLWWAIRVFANFQLFASPMLLFRSPTMDVVSAMLSSSVSQPIPLEWGPFLEAMRVFAPSVLLLLTVQTIQYLRDDLDVIFRAPLPIRSFAYLGIMLGLVLFGVRHGDVFVYFKF